MSDTSPRTALKAEEDRLERQLKAVRTALSALDAVSDDRQSRQQSDSLSHIRPNEFQGMTVAAAVAKYLHMLPRHSAHLEEILPALEAGGAQLGKQKDRHARTLRIAVRMNSKAKHPLAYDDATGIVSLRGVRAEARTA